MLLPCPACLTCLCCSNVAGIPLPGLYNMGPLSSGITGLSALNPSLAALVATNPGARRGAARRGAAQRTAAVGRRSGACLGHTFQHPIPSTTLLCAATACRLPPATACLPACPTY